MKKLVLAALGFVCASCAIVPVSSVYSPPMVSSPAPSAPTRGTLVCHRPKLEGERVLITAQTNGSYTASVRQVVEPYLRSLGATVVAREKSGYSLKLFVANESGISLGDVKVLKIHLKLTNSIGEILANGIGISSFTAGAYSWTYLPAVGAATKAAMDNLCTHTWVQ